MTNVDFYIIGATEQHSMDRFACLVAEKAYTKGLRVYMHLNSLNDCERVDEALWFFKEESFVPHGLLNISPKSDSLNIKPIGDTVTKTTQNDKTDHKLLNRTPIQIGTRLESNHHFDMLINLSHQIPDLSQHVKRVAEIVSQQPDLLLLKRNHYKQYKDRGFNLKKYDLRKQR